MSKVSVEQEYEKQISELSTVLADAKIDNDDAMMIRVYTIMQALPEYDRILIEHHAERKYRAKLQLTRSSWEPKAKVIAAIMKIALAVVISAWVVYIGIVIWWII